jgi:hypothetical protein
MQARPVDILQSAAVWVLFDDLQRRLEISRYQSSYLLSCRPPSHPSTFAHPLGGLGSTALANPPFDAFSYVGIDTLPVSEGAAEHRLANAAKQTPGNLIDQLCSLVIVKDITHQNARLSEIIVVGS